MDKLERHKQLTTALSEIYRTKNASYGDSFGKTFAEFGIISAMTRMSDKWQRLVTLSKGHKDEVKDESLIDTLTDLSNYCLMTIIELEVSSDATKERDQQESNK